MFRSTNGGFDWQILSSQSLDYLVYMTADVVIAADGPRFYRSTNGSVSWSLVYDDFDPLSQAEVQ